MNENLDYVQAWRTRLHVGQTVWTHDDHQCIIAEIMNIDGDTVTLSDSYSDDDRPYDVPRSKVFPVHTDALTALHAHQHAS